MAHYSLFVLTLFAACTFCNGTGLWGWAHRGDVRAELQVPPTLAGKQITATIVWRRRDANPGDKRVLITDNNNTELPSHAAVVEQHQGVVIFTPPSAGSYYVYWLPYTQSGEGHITFQWDVPGPSDSSWTTAGTWTAAKHTGAPQVFKLPAPVTSEQFRLQIPQTYGGFQPFVRELAVQIAGPNGGQWLPNKATSSNPAPLARSSGWQTNNADSGQLWCAMDGNTTTVWDATVASDAWLELAYSSPITIQAISVHTEGDTTHDAAHVVFQFQNSSVHSSPYPSDWQKLPAVAAAAITIQPRNDFESFAPMELSASVNETASVVVAAGGGAVKYLIFTEERSNPVRMQDRLPFRWVERALAPRSSALLAPTYAGAVVRGDYFTFQIAIFVPDGQDAIDDVTVSFSGFPAEVLATMTCFNSGGVSAQGTPFTSAVDVQPGHIKALWIGLSVPASFSPGATIAGTVTVAPVFSIRSAADATDTAVVQPTKVGVALAVSHDPAVTDPNVMDSNPANYTRLRWLNSKLAQDDDLVKPYTAVTVITNTNRATSTRNDAGSSLGAGDAGHSAQPLELGVLNRAVKVGANGFIQDIAVTRQASVHGVLPEKTTKVLTPAGGMSISLILADVNKTRVKLAETSHAPTVLRNGAGKVSWWAVSTGTVAGAAGTTTISVNVSMSLELDGYIDAQMQLSVASASSSLSSPTSTSTSSAPVAVVDLADVVVTQTLIKQHGLTWMGFDGEGEPVTSNTSDKHWKWSMTKRSSAVWVGSAEAGLRFHLKGASLDWDSPAVDASTLTPSEWGGGPSRLGGCNVTSSPTTGDVTIAAYTGPTSLNSSSNGNLGLHFDMSITPFKTANQSQHWSLRHFQVGYPSSALTSAADVKAAGANVINIHQGVETMINPYINYPFVPESVALLENYTKEANDLGMRVKFYYTAGTAWQRQHLGGNFTEAWVCPLSDGEFDAAIAQEGLAGRWLNYYIEGLRQSLEAAPHIDGIYFDGILFGRSTMQRVRKTLERHGPAPADGGLIDFHSGNDFAYQNRDIVDAVVYMNHWAYVDSIWIGEGYSYNSPPVYWLAQISGLAFGVFSDMLGTPQQYRGMLFGSTGRPGCAQPKPMWEFWDRFGIAETDMIGWWLPESEIPVTVVGGGSPFQGHDELVLATSYVIPGNKTLVAVASWAAAPVQVTLKINWAMLGLNESETHTVTVPAIDAFQTATSWPIGQAFTVPPDKGFLLVLEHGV